MLSVSLLPHRFEIKVGLGDVLWIKENYNSVVKNSDHQSISIDELFVEHRSDSNSHKDVISASLHLGKVSFFDDSVRTFSLRNLLRVHSKGTSLFHVES